MSTKIYNVWRTDRTFTQVMIALKRLKQQLIDKATIEARAIYVQGESFDEQKKWLQEVTKHILSGMNSIFNPVSSAVVYEFPGRSKTMLVQIFGLYRSENDLLQKFLRSIQGKDYHYQNQTDMDEGITAKEWRERKRVWDRLLPGIGVPGECGAMFDLVSKSKAIELLYIPHYEQCAKENPLPEGQQPAWSPQSRAWFVAQDAERAWHADLWNNMNDYKLRELAGKCGDGSHI